MSLIGNVLGNFTSMGSKCLSAVIGIISGKYTAGIITAIVICVALWFGWKHETHVYEQKGIDETTLVFTKAQDELKSQLHDAQVKADQARSDLNSALSDKSKAEAESLATQKSQEDDFNKRLADYQQQQQEDVNNAVAAATEQTKQDVGVGAVTILKQTQQVTKNESKKSGKTGSVNCFGSNDNGLRLIEDSIPGSVSK